MPWTIPVTAIPNTAIRASQFNTTNNSLKVFLDALELSVGDKLPLTGGGTITGNLSITGALSVGGAASFSTIAVSGAAAFSAVPTAPSSIGVPTGLVNENRAAAILATGATLGDLLDVNVSSSGTSAVNTRELVVTTGGIVNRNIPAGAPIGSLIGWKDNAANFHVFKMTVTPATGERIENSAINEVMDVTEQYAYFALKKVDSTTWRVL